MKKAILTSFMLFVTLFCIAQISVDNRIEFEVENGYRILNTFEFDDKGFVVYSAKTERTKEKRTTWRYELFDTDLKLVKKHEIDIPYEKWDDHHTHYTDRSIHTVLINKKRGNYKIISVTVPSMETAEVEGNLPENIRMETAVLGDYFFIAAGIYRESSNYFFTLNWKTGEKKSIPKILDHLDINKTHIWELMILNKNELAIDVREGENSETRYFVYFDAIGKKIKEVKFGNIDDEVIDATTDKTTDNQYLIAGTYGKQRVSEGVFFNFPNDNKVDLSKQYKFTELDNFFSYLPEKKQEKMKKKQTASKSINKNYRIAMHDVISLDNGYLLIGEAYHPTLQVDYTSSTPSINHVPGGYKYTHAVILKFDKKGDIEWNRTFKMQIEQKPLIPMKFINTIEKFDDYIKLVWNSNDFIFSKKIGFDGETFIDDMPEKIQIPDLGKKERTSSEITYWYDNYFLSYGQQDIVTPKSKRGERIQTIFFAHKIKYE